MTRATFLNRVRSLHNIDRDQLPKLSPGEWYAFLGNPVNYFMRANDTQADAIWREVEKWQCPVLIAEAPRDLSIPLRVRGVGRDADEPRSLSVALTERPTDDDVWSLHEFLRGWKP